MEDFAIKVEKVSKTFKLPHEKHSSVKSAFVNVFRSRRGYELQRALDNITFKVDKGEFFGIVGRNGSGKSTLLKLLAGIYTPTKGKIHTNGKLTPFIELGVGFNPELTGRENVFLNGALLGFNRKEMQAMYNDIVGFAELSRFMDQKLKNYSSGMQVRLAFSIAIRAKSDILLIDEVLAVGDAAFQSKCFNYFYELKRKGTTVVFVSHDRSALEQFCERGILINDGQVIDTGPIKQVLKSYSSVVLNELDKENKSTSHRKSGAYASIKSVKTVNENGEEKNKFKFGEGIRVIYEVEVRKKISKPILGVTVWQKNNDKAIFATNTQIEGYKTADYNSGDTITFETKLPKNLNDSEYIIEPAVANESATVFYDQLPDAASFYVDGSANPHAVLSSDTPLSLKVRRSS